VINAFAVPGGYIYMNRGILAQFNNEADRLGVEYCSKIGYDAHSMADFYQVPAGALIKVVED
jgi:predicted Zn-dependent protease